MLESLDVKRLACVSELRPCGARSQTRLLTVSMSAETRTAAIFWALTGKGFHIDVEGNGRR